MTHPRCKVSTSVPSLRKEPSTCTLLAKSMAPFVAGAQQLLPRGLAVQGQASRSRSRAVRVRCARGGSPQGRPPKERLYIGKGKYVEDDPRKYPGREENNAAGGWAGGEKGLWAFREDLSAEKGATASSSPSKPKRPSSATDVNLAKDFGAMAGGFPGGEVGLKTFNETGKVAKRAQPPTVGFGAYVAVALAGAYAACVYTTGDLNPQDWEFVTAGGGQQAAADSLGAKKVVSLPSLPAVDPVLAKQVAPPAAVAGGVVLAGVAVQAAIRKVAQSLSRGLVTALFGAAVLAAAARILNLL